MTLALTKSVAPVLNIKSIDEQSGEFEGYGSTFDSEPDSVGDIVLPGAFKESLSVYRSKGTMPKLFWQHNPDEPIGKWTEAKEDDTGLLLKGKLNMGVQRGREAAALLKEGDIDGLSIGYRIPPGGFRVDDETGVWYLEKLDLREVSIVSIGANQNAQVTSVKAAKTCHELLEKLKAGDRLTERQFESLFKGTWGFSNSQAERAARVHLKGSGDPAKAASQTRAFLRHLRS